MDTKIREFLLAGESIDAFLMLLVVLVLGMIISIICVFMQRRKFISAWRYILGEVVDDLNNKGAEIVESLIEIAMISADKNAALVIGMAKNDFENSKTDSDFYRKLMPIISIVNDNNHTANLNSDYAAARDAVKRAEELIDEFSQVADFEAFALLSVRANSIRKEIFLATKNLQGILYTHKAQIESEEKAE